MSYRDPYAEHYNDNSYYNQAGPGTGFNPYNSSQQPYQSYEQGAGGGYDNYDYNYNNYSDPYDRGAPAHQPPSKEGAALARDGTVGAPYGGESNGFGTGGFTSAHSAPKDKSARAIRNYRLEHRGNLWTKGSRLRCFGRFFCCTLLIGLFLVISIILALALWIRPPNIDIHDVGPASDTSSTVQFQQDGVQINLAVNISVNNPNYFSVNFREIKAELFYPINDTPIGGGTSRDVVFGSNAVTNWTFPLTVDYKLSSDPGSRIISDMAQRCGLVNGQRRDVDVDYRITLGLRILFITISPTVSNRFSFGCPLDPDELRRFLEGAGIDPSTFSGLLSNGK
ncbi:hypothetical protein AX16_008899 [Volvariella volvacea WC 439]|nr:hypothetical protein AX16_008899 [Volvariella volvacea WC 439]